jgi:acyl-CoA thioester hydrolase
VFEWTLRVDYADTDAMGVVHHASYLRYLERARIEWLRHQGHSYAEMESRGLFLPVTAARLEYRNSAVFDDELRIRLHLSKRSSVRLSLVYTLVRSETLIVEAETEHVLTKRLTDSQGRVRFKPVRLETFLGGE